MPTGSLNASLRRFWRPGKDRWPPLGRSRSIATSSAWTGRRSRALGLGPRGYAQVRKWEEGVGEPSAAALTAMRLLVELKQEREMPWMTLEMWDAAQNALDDTCDTLGRATSMSQRRSLTSIIQILRAILARRPK